MRTLLITGSGTTTASVAAATALAAATAGRSTLLASLGPAHHLGVLLGTTLSSTPQPVIEHLDACAYDSLDALSNAWEQNRGKLSNSLAQIGGDELPTLPGIDLFVSLRQLRAQSESYDLTVVDAGDYATLLRALATPDGLRWLLRVARTIVPTALLPFDWLGQAQDLRVAAEGLRDTATHSGGTTLGFVLPPEAAALDAARLAIPAFQMHGLTVGALIAGPLLPADVRDDRLAPLVASQREVLDEARTTWPTQPLLELPLSLPDHGLAALTNVGQVLYGNSSPETVFTHVSPIELLPGPALAISLPGLPRGALRLTLSGDELIIRVGPYRRHLPLPDQLRGITAIKATRDGDRVVIQRRV